MTIVITLLTSFLKHVKHKIRFNILYKMSGGSRQMSGVQGRDTGHYVQCVKILVAQTAYIWQVPNGGATFFGSADF